MPTGGETVGLVEAKEQFWNKRRVRLVVGLAIVIWMIIAYQITPYSYGRFLWPSEEIINLTNAKESTAEAPPITYNATITLTTVSDYSVGVTNPIHAVVTVYDVNRTDFANFYYAVIFEYSGFALNSVVTQPPPIANNIGLFSQIGNGVWKAETDIVFFHDWINFTGPILVPSYYAGRVINGTTMNQQMAPQIKALGISIKLQPQSFTDQLFVNETDIKYGAVGSAISLVLLLPIFDGIAIRKKKAQDKPEGKESKSDQSKVSTESQSEEQSKGKTHNRKDTRKKRDKIA